jgi:hypothetical protein
MVYLQSVLRIRRTLLLIVPADVGIIKNENIRWAAHVIVIACSKTTIQSKENEGRLALAALLLQLRCWGLQPALILLCFGSRRRRRRRSTLQYGSLGLIL